MEGFDLNGKYALVTGASSGIGKEISRCLAEEGAHLVLGSLPFEKEELEKWAAELAGRSKVRTWALAVDLSEDRGPETLYRMTREAVPHLDLLVNNAGVLAYGDFREISLAMHERLLRVNVRAYMILMYLALQDMTERGQGRILNVSSMAAFQGTPYNATYGASKAFVQSLSEAVDLEVKQKGVSILTLNPSITDTPMIKAYPNELSVYKLCKLRSPALTARMAVDALKKGKPVCIPGTENWILANVLPRVLPRGWMSRAGYRLLKKPGS